MDGRCISQNEPAQRWQVSEATLERWRSQRKGPQFLRLGGPGALPACGRGILRMRKDGSFRHRPKQFKSTHFASADGQKQFEKSTAYHLNVRAVEGS